MKEETASQIAVGVAAVRAAESMKPDGERVCYDPYAKYFLDGIYRTASISFLRKVFVYFGERAVPGAHGFVVSRTRYIDDYLQHCIEDGMKQLVILGAGYDSRAYRFDRLKGEVKVFEVDHQSTQRLKINRLLKVLNKLPKYVIYVAIDFDRENLADKLLESEYDRNLKTLFIWEGVTAYLTSQAVDDTLAFVTNNAGRGSSIIFDYLLKSVVDGTCEMEGVNEILKTVARRGEPYVFGIEEGTIEDFLKKRGFYQIENVDGQYLKNTYFNDTNRKVALYNNIVHATVKCSTT
jgi:methyltransferase (TIGR00027 family)